MTHPKVDRPPDGPAAGHAVHIDTTSHNAPSRTPERASVHVVHTSRTTSHNGLMRSRGRDASAWPLRRQQSRDAWSPTRARRSCRRNTSSSNLAQWPQVSVFRRARRFWGGISRTLLARSMILPRLRGSERRWLPACARVSPAEPGRSPASRTGSSCLSCAPSPSPGPHSESGSSARRASTSTTAQSSTSSRTCLPELPSFLACSPITTFAS